MLSGVALLMGTGGLMSSVSRAREYRLVPQAPSVPRACCYQSCSQLDTPRPTTDNRIVLSVSKTILFSFLMIASLLIVGLNHERASGQLALGGKQQGLLYYTSSTVSQGSPNQAARACHLPMSPEE